MLEAICWGQEEILKGKHRWAWGTWAGVEQDDEGMYLGNM